MAKTKPVPAAEPTGTAVQENAPTEETLRQGIEEIAATGATVIQVLLPEVHPTDDPDDPDYELPDEDGEEAVEEDEAIHALEEEAAEAPPQTPEEIQALAHEYREKVETPAEPEPPKLPSVRAEMLVDAKPLREFLSQVGAIADEVKVHMTRDGWNVKAVDPAHVAMIDVALPAQRIEALKLEWLRPPSIGAARPDVVELGIDVTKVLDVVKASVKGPVWFRYDEDKNRAEIAYGPAKRTMSTVDTTGMTDPKIPKLELPAVFTVPGQVLWDAIDACGKVSDHVRLTIEPGHNAYSPVLTVLAEGDVDKWEGSFQEECQWVKRAHEKHTSLFPLDYLTSIIKPVKGYRLTVHMGTDYPLRVSWDEGEADTGGKGKKAFDGATKGTYLLAPRIESEG